MRFTRRLAIKRFHVLIILFVIIVIFNIKHKLSALFETENDSQRKTENIEELFLSRQKRISNICKAKGRIPPTSVAESKYPSNTFVDYKHNIIYCPIEKVASTFLTNTLIVMNSKGKLTSPFQAIQTQKAKRILKTFGEFQKIGSKEFRESVMKEAMALLIVRDPFTRLFSAYVDKLYHPNHYYWEATGKTIEEYLNRQVVPGCGNTVTFSDFVKYVIHDAGKNNSQLDPHFTPIYQHTDPCMSKYSYIMKLENLKDEFFYIMTLWNSKFNLNLTISYEDFEKESAISIAADHVSLSFLTMERYASRCNISSYNFLLRTWRYLQITGILPKSVNIPFPNDISISLVTKRMFFDAVFEVHSNVIDWADLRAQRQDALVHAYQDLDETDIRALKNVLQKDCTYFGYDTSPSYLNKASKSRSTFNYFDGILIS